MFSNILYETIKAYHTSLFPDTIPTYHKGLKFDLAYDPHVRNLNPDDGWFLLSCMPEELIGRTFRTYLVRLYGSCLYYFKVTEYKELDKSKVVAYRVVGVHFKL